MEDLLQQVTAALAPRAPAYDQSGAWPAESLAAYGALGGWGWGVPRAYGGTEMAASDRLRVYGALARGDMGTALYITQHESALDLLVNSDNEPLKRRVLPRYARGEGLTTIGYAQLTTSHQGGPPVLTARFVGDGTVGDGTVGEGTVGDGTVGEGTGGDGTVGEGIVLDGFMPWVTGAPDIETVAAGAVMPDGLQVVVLLPFATPGVTVEPPMRLLALDASHTSVVRCASVRLGMEALVAGPVPLVLARRSPIRRLSVSATGLGLAAAMEDHLRELEGNGVPGQPRVTDAVAREREALDARLAGLAAEAETSADDAPPPGADDPALATIAALRADINALLVRLTGVVMTLAKGTGYREGQTAHRLVREALFFCVWSAPNPVRQATLKRLLPQMGTDEV